MTTPIPPWYTDPYIMIPIALSVIGFVIFAYLCLVGKPDNISLAEISERVTDRLAKERAVERNFYYSEKQAALRSNQYPPPLLLRVVIDGEPHQFTVQATGLPTGNWDDYIFVGRATGNDIVVGDGHEANELIEQKRKQNDH